MEIHKGTHDLSRRAITYRLPGLSFREYLELNYKLSLSSYPLDKLIHHHQSISDEIVSKLTVTEQKILPLFKIYLEMGYYPYFHELKNIAKFQITLEQNVHTILESDLSSIYPQLSANSVRKIKQLLVFLAQNVPFTPNLKQLAQVLDIGDERTLKNYLKYLEEAELILSLLRSSSKLGNIDNPGKIYLKNSNLMYALASDTVNIGTVREVFFLEMLSQNHELTLPLNGDFLVDKTMLFEIGGQGKNFKQLSKNQPSYVASDGIEIGQGNKIPLWIFGFLY